MCARSRQGLDHTGVSPRQNGECRRDVAPALGEHAAVAHHPAVLFHQNSLVADQKAAQSEQNAPAFGQHAPIRGERAAIRYQVAPDTSPERCDRKRDCSARRSIHSASTALDGTRRSPRSGRRSTRVSPRLARRTPKSPVDPSRSTGAAPRSSRSPPWWRRSAPTSAGSSPTSTHSPARSERVAAPSAAAHPAWTSISPWRARVDRRAGDTDPQSRPLAGIRDVVRWSRAARCSHLFSRSESTCNRIRNLLVETNTSPLAGRHHLANRDREGRANDRGNDERERRLLKQRRHLVELFGIDVAADQPRDDLAE